MLKVTQIPNPMQANDYRINSSHTYKQDSDNADSPKSIKTRLLEKESKSQVDDQFAIEVSPMITEKDCRVQPDTKAEKMHGESTETSKIDESSAPGPLTPLLVVKATNTITE